MIRRVLFCSLLACAAFAQVNLRFTPEPMAVPAAVLANAKDMGRWTIVGCNDGPMAVSIASERIDMAAGPIRLIDWNDALLVLNAHVRRSTASVILQIVGVAGQAAAIATSMTGAIKNPTATSVLGVGSGLLPELANLVRPQVPSAVPLQSPLKYPVTLQPGACFTDFRFAAKMRNPQVVTGVIK